MMDNKTFLKIDGLGTLLIEHIFYNYDEPILFVCVADMTRYICSCCRLSEEWICAEVTEYALIKMIENKKTLAQLFTESNGKKFLTYWTGKDVQIEYTDKFSEEVLPKAGATLDLNDKYTSTYKDMLWQSVKTLKTEHTVQIVSNTVYSDISTMQVTMKDVKVIRRQEEIALTQKKDQPLLTAVFAA